MERRFGIILVACAQFAVLGSSVTARGWNAYRVFFCDKVALPWQLQTPPQTWEIRILSLIHI